MSAADSSTRIAELELQLEQLKNQLNTSSPAPEEHGRWRAPVAALLIILGVICAPLAVAGAWARSELTSTDQFVATFGPLIEDPAVQRQITTEAMTLIDKNVDINKLTSEAVAALANIDGMPKQIAEALPTFEPMIASAVQSGITSLMNRALDSQIVADAWNQALRLAHNQLESTLSGDPNAVITISDNGTVAIQLGPIIEAIKQRLLDQGISAASVIPAVSASVPIAQNQSFAQAQSIYSLAVNVGTALPFLALGLLVAGVLVARRRAGAAIWAGLAVAFMMLVTIIAFDVFRVVATNSLSTAGISAGATGAVYDAVTENMAATAVAVCVLGIVLAIVVYLVGPFRWSGRLRSVLATWAAGIRTTAAEHGVSTGRFGVGLYHQRRLVLAIVAIAAAAVIILRRPLTPAVVVWTAVGALLVLAVLALLQRPDGAPPVIHRVRAQAGPDGMVTQTVMVPEAGAPSTVVATTKSAQTKPKPPPKAPPAVSDHSAGSGATDAGPAAATADRPATPDKPKSAPDKPSVADPAPTRAGPDKPKASPSTSKDDADSNPSNDADSPKPSAG